MFYNIISQKLKANIRNKAMEQSMKVLIKALYLKRSKKKDVNILPSEFTQNDVASYAESD